jgi:hypothetical protein
LRGTAAGLREFDSARSKLDNVSEFRLDPIHLLRLCRARPLRRSAGLSNCGLSSASVFAPLRVCAASGRSACMPIAYGYDSYILRGRDRRCNTVDQLKSHIINRLLGIKKTYPRPHDIRQYLGIKSWIGACREIVALLPAAVAIAG